MKTINLGPLGFIWWMKDQYGFYIAWQTHQYSGGNGYDTYSPVLKCRVMFQYVNKKCYLFMTRKNEFGIEF